MPNTSLHGLCADIGVANFPPVLEYAFSSWMVIIRLHSELKNGQGNLTFNTVHYRCLCLDIAKSLSTVQPL